MWQLWLAHQKLLAAFLESISQLRTEHEEYGNSTLLSELERIIQESMLEEDEEENPVDEGQDFVEYLFEMMEVSLEQECADDIAEAFNLDIIEHHYESNLPRSLQILIKSLIEDEMELLSDCVVSICNPELKNKVEERDGELVIMIDDDEDEEPGQVERTESKRSKWNKTGRDKTLLNKLKFGQLSPYQMEMIINLFKKRSEDD